MNESQKITLNDIIKQFNCQKIAGDNLSLNQEIVVQGINRAGLELAGFIAKEQDRNRRIVWLSNKENEFMHSLNKKEREKRYKSLISSKIPAIFISPRFNDEILIKVANELNFPVIQANYQTDQFYVLVGNYIDNKLAKKEEIHATLVNIYGLGILIEGPSGIGKSENALELIKKGHLFIGDDRIVLQRQAERVIGWSVETLRNLIEIRGIGILDITKMYGFQQIADHTEINLIIHLEKIEKIEKIERLGEKFKTKNFFGIEIPYISIPITLGKNIANLIEVAVIKLKLSNNGIDIVKEFQEKRHEVLDND